ncbi:FAD/NAD(P)-binding domain-containing protein [Aspergillus steynii IBT 23096]|uniref:FAD/NAD(P)-binding domain-containing protein n=1 Tax=Aspergillus steynii IBT 23096 TaxID=1392250 RepID=A0A2I2GND3_9EURO|nr:FAD/NAD(P)-binding domain-containing protein [Aspergillus steynii IBT 23096]PLB54373.1 FAD/NAD(P)-binding domain-containing protein [Aspergillus steynii IBT 23096]
MSAAQESARKKVAIVGSGMAGLISAFLLRTDRRGRYDVEILEMQDHLSLDSASYTLATKDGPSSQQSRLDLPMRVFAGGYYENLKRMYEYFNIKFISPRFIYTLSSLPKSEGQQISPHFIHSSNNHTIPPLQPVESSFGAWILELVYLAICYFWFTACCFWVKPRPAPTFGKDESFRQYLERIRLPRYYVNNYLLPLVSSVTTCTHDAVLAFPANDIVEYERRTFRKPHFLVVGGVRKVQEKLAENQKVHYGAKVSQVQDIGNNEVQVSWTTRDGQAHAESFDFVIMAVTPDVVGAIFPPLRKVMAEIPTVPVESVVHYDFSRISRCSNHLKQQMRPDQSNSSVGFNLAQPIHICSDLSASESIHEHPSSALITTFPIGPIDPDKVVHRAKFTRVLRTTRSRAIVNRVVNTTPYQHFLGEKQEAWRNGDGNVFLVGGWCWDGMVMLEGCIFSAMRVANCLDVEIPWLANNPLSR